MSVRRAPRIRHGIVAAAVLAVLIFVSAGCQPSQPAAAETRAAAPAAAAQAPATQPSSPTRSARARDGASAATTHDLRADETMGGHTLARHVGRTDAELAERLRREPHISAASTYTDRATAEHAVAAALAAGGRPLSSWQSRSGRRPNLVLHYTERGGQPLGRSLSRGARDAVPAFRALVVLRWDERRERFYVLTSYPEADR